MTDPLSPILVSVLSDYGPQVAVLALGVWVVLEVAYHVMPARWRESRTRKHLYRAALPIALGVAGALILGVAAEEPWWARVAVGVAAGIASHQVSGWLGPVARAVAARMRR